MNLKYYDYPFETFRLRYVHDADTQKISMLLLPPGMPDCTVQRREWLDLPELASAGIRCRAWSVGSLCHLSLRHHSQSQGAGETLKYGESTQLLNFVSQKSQNEPWGTKIITRLRAEEGYEIIHTVSHYDNENGVEIETEFYNGTGAPVTLDMLTGFSLDNLTPFDTQDAPERLVLHRVHGGWSLEGKRTQNTVEDLNLDHTWFNAIPESERYGCLGSFPVNRWFPFGAVEDKTAGVFWAAQLACNASWQMELSRDSDCYSFSGGGADAEFGSWWKTIENGGRFSAPKAFVSVGQGSLERVCHNLTEMHQKYADRQPACEQSLPVMFNEWCTSWGKPTEQEILDIAQRLEGTGVRYLTVDAGWSKTTNSNLGQGGNGEWICDDKSFPHGMKWLSRKLKEKGIGLGVWFEFEVTTRGATVFEKAYDALHLQRGGKVIVSGLDRSFWDLRNPEVVACLKEKVIDFLRENEFSYMKVDYNGSIGIGCDGAESLGEGLRAQMEAVRNFFLLIRRELPDLVLENCASGGHRLEPSMMDITAMSSFSDSHECKEIPYIAANIQLLVLARQSQVWAVLHPEMTRQELCYRLSAGFLGRLCLSGNYAALSEAQRQTVGQALHFYAACAPVIKSGFSQIYGERGGSTHYLHGTQAVVRKGADDTLLVVCHSFRQPMQSEIEIPLNGKTYCIAESFGNTAAIRMENDGVYVRFDTPYDSAAMLLITV